MKLPEISLRVKSSLFLTFLYIIWRLIKEKRNGLKGVSSFKRLYEDKSNHEKFTKIKLRVKELLDKTFDEAAVTNAHLPEEIHLAIAGGGFKNLYAMGVYFVLQHFGIKVEKISGASSGTYTTALSGHFLQRTLSRVDSLQIFAP